MKRIVRNTMILLTSFTTSAYAAGGSGGEEGSILIGLFYGFCALMSCCMLLPALKHFIDVLKGLSSDEVKTASKRLS